MRQLSEKELLNHASEIAEQGYSVMEGVIDNKFRIQILDELEQLESARPGGDIPPGPFTGFVTKRWFDLLNDDDQTKIIFNLIQEIIKSNDDVFLKILSITELMTDINSKDLLINTLKIFDDLDFYKDWIR